MLRRVCDQILLALHRYPNAYLWLRSGYRSGSFRLQYTASRLRDTVLRLVARDSQQPLKDSKREHKHRLTERLHAFLQDPGALLQFPTLSAPPLVSIILVTYNRAEFTLECLRRILLESLSIPLEVIVVDNCSTDRTQALFSKVSGITFLPQRENLHFLRGSNLGASHAKGKYLLFLNSDAFVSKGAISSSVSIFSSEAHVGAVGGKLLLPNGQIQEAGCMIYPDGTARGLLRHEDPSHPAAQVLRAVDFCSGAFLVTSTEIFRTLGGFDERYAPAYYEDADYCVRLRDRGLRTMYNPQAVIEHFEYGSATAKNSSLLLMQERQKIFAAQHPNYQSVLPKKVLIIDERLPYSRYGAGYPRTQAIIRTLQELGITTSVFPLFHLDPDDSVTKARQELGDQVELHLHHRDRLYHLIKLLRRSHAEFSHIIVSRPSVAGRLEPLWALLPEIKSRKIFDAEAIFSERERRYRTVVNKPMSEREFGNRLRFESATFKDYTHIVVVNKYEEQLVRELGFTNVSVLAHSVSALSNVPPYDQRYGTLTVGTFHWKGTPNVDGLLWYLQHVTPLLPSSAQSLTVAGGVSYEEIKLLASPQVAFTGTVPSLTEYYNKARVCVCPTRFSAGIPLKVIEAGAHGVPAVITSLLASQLGWSHGVEALVADDPETFAAHVQALLHDKVLWQTISRNCHARVKADFNQEVLRNAVAMALGVTPSAPHKSISTFQLSA